MSVMSEIEFLQHFVHNMFDCDVKANVFWIAGGQKNFLKNNFICYLVAIRQNLCQIKMYLQKERMDNLQ